MIFWQGYGFLVVVFGFAAFFGSIQIEKAGLLPTAVSITLMFLVSGLAMVLTGRYFDKNDPEEVIVNPKTGVSAPHKRKHTFMFIPMTWIGYFLIFVGIFFWFIPSKS